MNNPKEILILSGKGGTGKTTITSNLIKKFPKKIIADTDVDAADMFILLDPKIQRDEVFKGKAIAKINYDKCVNCDVGINLCRFDAIKRVNDKVEIDEASCDGCDLCMLACPEKAITMEEQDVGHWYISETEEGPFVHAKLFPGGENSGNLVTMVKQQAKIVAREKEVEHIILDGPPGIGCPVISALSGSSFVVIVTEATLSAYHDLKRIKELIVHFKINFGIVINKANFNTDIVKDIENLCEQENIPIIERIDYEECVMKALNKKEYAYDHCPEFKQKIDNIYEYINEHI